MYTELFSKMPYGMHEQIRGCVYRPELDQRYLDSMIRDCRHRYPDYFKELEQTFAEQQNDELAPVAVAAGGLVVGYSMAMGRKIYNDHYSGDSKKEAFVASEINDRYSPEGNLPDEVKEVFANASANAMDTNEMATLPDNSNELAKPIYNHLIDDHLRPPKWFCDWKSPLSHLDRDNTQELAPPLVFVGSAIVGAAIADQTYDKVIDGVTKYLTK